MKMRSVLFVLFVFLSSVLNAQVTISGVLKNQADKVLYAYANLDELSGKRIHLGTANLDDTGKFKMLCDIQQTTRVFLVIDQLEGVLYAEPGKTYEVNYFPNLEEASIVTFDRSPVEITYLHLPKNDLNEVIPQFNNDLYAFLDEHFYDFAVDTYTGSDAVKKMQASNGKSDLFRKDPNAQDSVKVVKSEKGFVDWVGNFETEMQTKYAEASSNAYFNDYMRYSIAELKMMAGMNRKQLYNTYFMSQPVQTTHPAYMKFFSAYYDHILERKSIQFQDKVMRIVNGERDPHKLYDLLKSDSLYMSEFVGELVVLKGLKDLYANTQYSKSSIILTMENLIRMPTMKLYKDIAQRIVDHLTKCTTGWELENFTLLDIQREKWVWNEQEPRYTYFFFYADWSSASKKEMLMMQKWFETYGKDVRFVAISMDDHIDKMISYAQKNRDFKYEFLYGGVDPLLREKFMLRSIPHAVLVDMDGKIMYNYTRKPSEGLNLDLDKITALLRKPKGGNTWKD
jgi:hypothetical protein